jgi:multidrug resistance efflux pump
LKISLKRADLLSQTKAISREEHDQLRFAKQGQEQRIAKLQEALEELKKRMEQADGLMKKSGRMSAGMAENGAEQLKPCHLRIEVLQAERARLKERLDEGLVRAPCNGLVLKVNRFPGERCKTGEPLLTLLEEGSVHVVLYLPQSASALVAEGDEVSLVVDPYPQTLRCTVSRLGDRFEPAPEHLKRHYREGQKLLPVYLQPKDEWTRWMGLRVGGVAKLQFPWARI